MVELRWAVPEGTSTARPKLQYRELSNVGGGLGLWGEWTDVPMVVVPSDPQRPVPTAPYGIPGEPPSTAGAPEPCRAVQHGPDAWSCVCLTMAPNCNPTGTRYASGVKETP